MAQDNCNPHPSHNFNLNPNPNPQSEQQVADLRAAHEVLGAAQGQAQAALREAKRELQSRDLTVDELQKQVGR